MISLSPDQLEDLITEYGWTFARAEGDLWHSGFRGEFAYFPMDIRLSSTCVSFEVCPLLEFDKDLRTKPDLVCDLLELNASLQLVKLAIKESGAISLSCQVLTTGFGAETLDKVLGIMAYYADSLAGEVQSRLLTSEDTRRPRFLS